jgi:isoleucyl-tRNA synthetase
VPAAALEPVDRYILSRYAELALSVIDAYEAFNFQGVVHGVNAFATVDLSAFYVDVSKDRLYTLGAKSPSRRAAQTAMYVMVDGLARLIAPILPVTAEQLWKALPGRREVSVHVATFPDRSALETLQLDQATAADWERLLALRDAVNVELEARRREKLFGTSLGGMVTVAAGSDDFALLQRYEASLPMLFIVSTVRVVPGDGLSIAVGKADGVKCERCWRVVPSVTSDAGREGLCDRCVDALAEPVGS